MGIKKFSFLALLVGLSSHVYAKCENYGDKCPEHSPCCSGGWCGTGQLCLATKCDTVNSFSPTSCLPKPLCINYEDTFDTNKIVPSASFSGDPSIGYSWTSDFVPNHATVENGNLILNMPLDTDKNAQGNLQGFGATVSSVRWIQYGKVSARVKAASTSPGVVTAFIIRNNEGDEIDFEWVGGHPNEVQTNYYYDGVIDYTHGGKHNIGANTATGYHDYTIDWDEEYIKFYVDNKVVRTIYKKDTWDSEKSTYKFPSRLALVQLGIWDGGSGAEGTVDWAGGKTDWSDPKKVYKAYFDNVKVECKYGGNETQVWPTPSTTSATSSTLSIPSTTSIANSTSVATSNSVNVPTSSTKSTTSPTSDLTSSALGGSASTYKKIGFAVTGIISLIVGGLLD
ncbi:putative glycosidase CRH2 [Basidiobolus ranarum]|uniref:Glycosidase CRH2 n=1 Tax=Basidiobolus ranarum TaxID=34480 RepID=A0ABR2VVX3_9FUNG